MRAAMLDYGALWRFPPSALLAAYRERVRQMALRVRTCAPDGASRANGAGVSAIVGVVLVGAIVVLAALVQDVLSRGAS